MMQTERLDALVTWARMLAQLQLATDGDTGEALVRAVPDETAVEVARALLDAAKGLGVDLSFRDEGDRVLGSMAQPWTALLAFSFAMRKGADAVACSPAELVRVAIDAETRRLLGLGRAVPR